MVAGVASTFCDVASLSTLPAITGGQLRHVPGIAEDRGGGTSTGGGTGGGGEEGVRATLEAAVTAAVLGPGGGVGGVGGEGGEVQVVAGHDAVLRLRASSGLRPRHVVQPNGGGDEAAAASGVIALPMVDRHLSFGLELSHDPKVPPHAWLGGEAAACNRVHPHMHMHMHMHTHMHTHMHMHMHMRMPT